MAFSLNQLSQKWTKYGQIGIGWTNLCYHDFIQGG